MGVRVVKRHNRDGSIIETTSYSRKTITGLTKTTRTTRVLRQSDAVRAKQRAEAEAFRHTPEYAKLKIKRRRRKIFIAVALAIIVMLGVMFDSVPANAELENISNNTEQMASNFYLYTIFA